MVLPGGHVLASGGEGGYLAHAEQWHVAPGDGVAGREGRVEHACTSAMGRTQRQQWPSANTSRGERDERKRRPGWHTRGVTTL